MPQRNSNYGRKAGDLYETSEWVTEALMSRFRFPAPFWECACGNDKMSDVIKKYGETYPTDINRGVDFLKTHDMIFDSKTIITNPPFSLAEEFIRHALELTKPVRGCIAMLLRIDFDSAKTRRDMFLDCPAWGTKLVLTKRIKWFETPGIKAAPSDNHAWYIWDWNNNFSKPTIRYYVEGDK